MTGQSLRRMSYRRSGLETWLQWLIVLPEFPGGHFVMEGDNRRACGAGDGVNFGGIIFGVARGAELR